MFTVTVTDGGGLSETMRYIITVVDQNDNTPTFQDGLYFNIAIPENTEVSGCYHGIFYTRKLRCLRDNILHIITASIE